jgi:hypothetical protein
MEKVFFKTFLPVIAGFTSVLSAIMIIKSFSSYTEINIYDSFFTLFIPTLLVIALLIQYFVILPLFQKVNEKFNNNRKIIFGIIATISIVMGFLSAIFFKEENTGSVEFFNLFFFSFMCFLIYILVDLFFVKIFE